ncbi:hypothetical protein ACFSUS_21825 [Spirosoma soli]|uniref:Glycosyltransferase family 4 protein n=1 Tax=Spirosoma soli TaxID=1770529 RepID=A0ABW5MA74_9BACT
MTDKTNQRLVLIAPTAPPSVCGVSDYSYQTAQALQHFYKSIHFGVERVPDSMVSSTLGPVPVMRWQEALKVSSTSAESSDILLNYTPASYAWSCLPIGLILALRRFKAANPDNHIFVFVHEAWNGSGKLRIHQIIRNRLAKWSIGQIGKIAGGIAAVTTGQKKDLESLLRKHKVHLALVGANILPIEPGVGLTSAREAGVWVVFGLAHTRLWALQAYMPLLVEMHARGVLRQIRSIGPTDNNYALQEAALAEERFGAGMLVQLGVLKPAQVSEELLKAEAALVKQDADSLRKSGSFAALAAHGVSVVCEVPVTLDEPPGGAIFRPSELVVNPEIISNEESNRRRQQLHVWFWSTRSWEAIGENMLNWMSTQATNTYPVVQSTAQV